MQIPSPAESLRRLLPMRKRLKSSSLATRASLLLLQTCHRTFAQSGQVLFSPPFAWFNYPTLASQLLSLSGNLPPSPTGEGQ